MLRVALPIALKQTLIGAADALKEDINAQFDVRLVK